MKKYLFFSLIVVTQLSCTKTIDFDDEGLANKAVMNCIIWPDKGFSVQLSQNSSILIDQQTITPLEGSLEIYEDGKLIRQLSSQFGNFSASDLHPKSGKNYRIVITSNGRQIDAETTIPIQTDVLSIDTTSVKNKNGITTINFQIKIKDPMGDDYYRIVATDESLIQGYDPINQKIRKYYLNKSQNLITSNDAVFKSVYNNFGDAVVTHGPENDYFIFPDTYFQDKVYTLQFQILTMSNGDIGSGDLGDPGNPFLTGHQKLIFDRQVVHVQRLSKELYNYMKYLKLYNYYHDNPFSEPISVYSNVKNGVGIFAGFNDGARYTYEKLYVPYSMDTISLGENYRATMELNFR